MADPGVHDPDLGVQLGPIGAFTMDRSERSRWSETRSSQRRRFPPGRSKGSRCKAAPDARREAYVACTSQCRARKPTPQMDPFQHHGVRFRRDQAKCVRERLWHPSHTFEDHADGSLTLTLRVAPTVEVKRWILGWGAGAGVLEPERLRHGIAAEARKIAEREA